MEQPSNSSSSSSSSSSGGSSSSSSSNVAVVVVVVEVVVVVAQVLSRLYACRGLYLPLSRNGSCTVVDRYQSNSVLIL